eukprot:GFUD01008432.1.p1 GENE.GFUD01008432.1~~GFUD01008432.1.p1  ORF type:complete len:273 (+),score=55.96 GFUD01008432.1:217-1035(+)
MAPVEVDVIPYNIMAPKVVDKAFELPFVTSAYTEIAKVASPYTSTITPMVEVGFTIVKTKVDESVVPRIPGFISRTMSSAVDHVTAVVEKIDTFACGGIDRLTEKVPELKEATPELIANSKETASSYATSATDYVASFSLAQVWLKFVDSGLDIAEGAVELTGGTEEGVALSSLHKIHTTANTIRISGNKMAGTEKAKRIEEASIFGSLLEISGIAYILGALGLVGTTKESAEPATDDADEVFDEDDAVEEVASECHSPHIHTPPYCSQNIN